LRSGPTKSKKSRLSVTQGNFVDACRNRLGKVWAIVPVPPLTAERSAMARPAVPASPNMTPMLALADLDGRYIPYPSSARFRWLLWAPFIGRRAGLPEPASTTSGSNGFTSGLADRAARTEEGRSPRRPGRDRPRHSGRRRCAVTPAASVRLAARALAGRTASWAEPAALLVDCRSDRA